MLSWSSSRICGASAGIGKMVVKMVAFAGTEPHSIENFKPPCFPNVLVLFRQVVRAVGEYLSLYFSVF